MKTEQLRKKIGVVVEGPMGLQMPETVARQIESIAKTVPKDFHYGRHAMNAKALTPDTADARAEISYITTDAVDREGEVFLPAGGDWKTFNNSVMWCHKYGPSEGWSGLPVGTCQWMKAQAGQGFMGTLAKTRYSSKPEDMEGFWLPDAIVALQRGTPPACTGKSIGAIPTNMREATKAELDQHPDWDGVPIFDRWIGLEYSACPIPMNQTCEMQAVEKSLSGESSDKYLAAMEAAYKDMGDDDEDTMSVNQPAVDKCAGLIAAGNVHDSNYSGADETGEGDMCLGVATAPDGKKTFGYPVGKAVDGGMMVHKKALEQAMTRSLVFKHKSIHEAAKMLHGKCVEQQARQIQIANTKSIEEYRSVRKAQMIKEVRPMVAARLIDQIHRAKGTP